MEPGIARPKNLPLPDGKDVGIFIVRSSSGGAPDVWVFFNRLTRFEHRQKGTWEEIEISALRQSEAWKGRIKSDGTVTVEPWQAVKTDKKHGGWGNGQMAATLFGRGRGRKTNAEREEQKRSDDRTSLGIDDGAGLVEEPELDLGFD